MYMARIAGIDLPRDKRIVIALTYIYGVGKTSAQKILARMPVFQKTFVYDDLTPEQEDKIRAACRSVTG
jgi:small subunit ribosomal protein S13